MDFLCNINTIHKKRELLLIGSLLFYHQINIKRCLILLLFNISKLKNYFKLFFSELLIFKNILISNEKTEMIPFYSNTILYSLLKAHRLISPQFFTLENYSDPFDINKFANKNALKKF